MKLYCANLCDIQSHPELIKKYQDLLSVAEQERYQKMTDLNRRLQFLIGRALIHEICHQSPDLLPNGKPLVNQGYISLAHSGPYIILVTDDTPVGIDIEDTSKNKDFIRLANRLNFKLADNHRFSFYRQFTRYESTLKLASDNRPIYHTYYLIDTFIICISSLNNNKKIDFINTIPFLKATTFTPTYIENEVQYDL